MRSMVQGVKVAGAPPAGPVATSRRRAGNTAPAPAARPSASRGWRRSRG